MPTPWQIECLKSRLRSLELEINRVAEKDHPYPDPDTVYEALRAVIASRSLLFRDALENYPLGDPASEHKLRETLIPIAESADEVAEVFSYANRVDSARIPFEILRSLSWVASSLINEECHAVVRLDQSYNYTILSCRREFKERLWEREWLDAVTRMRSNKELASDHADATTPGIGATTLPYTVLLLGFPSYDANSILLHALAAHELGHEIFFQNEKTIGAILDSSVKTVTHKEHRCHMALQEYARRNIKIPGGGGRKDDYEKSVDQIRANLLEFLRQWIIEIFSDLYAANLIGPTFIAAFDKIELEPYRVDKSHPPGYLRRELVKQYLIERLPHVIADTVWKPLFDSALLEPIAIAEEDDPLAPLYEVGEEVCRLSLNGLSQLMDASPLAENTSLTKIINDTSQCFDNLAPPSVGLQVTGTDSDVNNFWLLMYAAWHYRFDAIRFRVFADTYVKGDENKAEELLGNLLLHGLQSLEIKFLWEREALERIGSDGN